MRISLQAQGEPSPAQIKVIGLLESSHAFEKEVWRLRGLFGVEPKDYSVEPITSPELEVIYNAALAERPDLHIHQELLDLSEDEINELEADHSKQELCRAVLAAKDKHGDLMNAEVAKVMNRFNIPVLMEGGMVVFIHRNVFYLGQDEGYIALHIGPEELDALASMPDQNTWDKLIDANAFRSVRGVHITLTAKFKDNEQPSKKQLHSWIDERWEDIKFLMEVANLPDFKTGREQFVAMKVAFDMVEERRGKGESFDEAITATSLELSEQLMKAINPKKEDYQSTFDEIEKKFGTENLTNFYNRYKAKLKHLERSETDTDL